MVDVIFIGLSLGSILLLVALGLAITYGAMGVINMAHGEMVMLGAYTTVMAGIYLHVGLLASIPLAFAVTALVGLAIERVIVRRLYRRLLDTLLATWGVALLIQQAVRLELGLAIVGLFALAPLVLVVLGLLGLAVERLFGQRSYDRIFEAVCAILSVVLVAVMIVQPAWLTMGVTILVLSTLLVAALLVRAWFGSAIEKHFGARFKMRVLDALLVTCVIIQLLPTTVRDEFARPLHISGLGAGLQNVHVPEWLVGSINIFGIDINAFRGFIILVTIALTALTWFIMYRLPIGMQVRAIIRNPKMAAACGINVKRVNALTFAYGSGLAGVAGVMMSGFKTVFPDMGTPMVVDGFLVVVVGGVGSLFGSVASAGLLGQLQGGTASFTNDSLARAVVFAAVILVIVLKPQGLFSYKGR